MSLTTPDRMSKATERRTLSESQRRQAVQARDKTADGSFVYAVRTTGVYCRPSCGSCVARPENVVFYDTAQAAKSAGYRACKRCRPDEPSEADRSAALVARACAILAEAEEAPALGALSEAVGVSASHFHRTFKAVMGITPKAYINAERARRLRSSLGTGSSVTSAIYDAGYGSSSRFYERAQDRLGMTASVWRRGAAGVAIRFAVGQCSLGAILVAATDKGLCAVEFGDDPQALLRGLEDRFPKARLIGADERFERLVAEVVGAVEDPRKASSLPLDVRGTAFQERVWQALRAIPPGKRASYAEIALAIGAPKATRAVAQACGANPAAVAIPCHRVVRMDGGLGGYKWGVARKEALLAVEAA
jgi:AraC family transcriptional regulator of adaptative response/methylated-DNA-[protein]-cysteine methyltransferase